MNATLEIKEKMLEFFCQHLIGLSVTYRHTTGEDDGQPSRHAAASGTLIIIEGVLCFLTAGHVLEVLDQLRTNDKVKIESAALVDTLGPKRISNIPIPFDLLNADPFYLVDDDAGLDFGVIMLAPHYRRLLAKNGVTAIAEENWKHQHRVTFDFYWMLGLPAEFTSDRVPTSGGPDIGPTMLPLKRLDAAPDRRPPTRHPLFVGQLDPALRIDVKGMSGGPIIGFRKEPNGGGRYWVVALQSSWEPDTKIVYGCLLPVLASLMTNWAKKAASEATNAAIEATSS